MGGAHCGPEPDGSNVSCTETDDFEVDRDSPLFDEAFVQKAAWQVSGVFFYSSFHPEGEPTDYELSLRWSEDPYLARLRECDDGSSEVLHSDLPITAEFKTADGAFDGTFSGEVRFLEGLKYTFDAVPAIEILGNYEPPAAAAEHECQQPEIELAQLNLDRKRQTGHFVSDYEGDEPLDYVCYPSHYRVGVPRVELVQRLE